MVTALLYNKGVASATIESRVAYFFMQNKDNKSNNENNENKGVAGIIKKKTR